MEAVSRAAVLVYDSVDRERFLREIYPMRKPAVLKGIPLGSCTSKWTVDYLSTTGGRQEVKVHVASIPQMDFINKNFIYRTLPFDVFVKRAAESVHTEYFLSEDEKYYLRSLGVDPRKDVADIRKQFPPLAEDINIPEFFEKDQFFSSVFRISSPGLQLWTHYDNVRCLLPEVNSMGKLSMVVWSDWHQETGAPSFCTRVMDNFLIQVIGRKRVILFSPQDAPYLYLTGDKSEVLDVENPDLRKYPQFAKAQCYECQLDPGDVLFIPALWFHNTVAKEFGVGVNVFWKHLPANCYDKTDTYGNKDPVAASRAMQILDRALKTLEELPDEYRDFYARRMVLRIQSKSYSNHYK